MEAFVDIDGVTLKYRGASGDIVALQDATLKVQRGEFAAVVGPSGCGKSTLMRLVTGLHRPTAGTIAIDGKEVTGPVKMAGMAFQNANMLPWRKVIDNVKSHGDQIRRFMTAVQQAIKREKSDEAYATSVLSKHLNVTDPKALHETWAYYTKVLPDVPTPTVEQLQTSVTELAPTNPAVKNLDLSTLVDPSFVSAD